MGENTPNNNNFKNIKNTHRGLMKRQRGWKAKMNWFTSDSKKWLQNQRKLGCPIRVAGDSVKGQWLCVLNESSTVTKAQAFKLRYRKTVKVLIANYCY